ncbi:hypothetical protein DRW48_06685 [Paracoccus suum]|uniref:Excinuclease ABC subunit A n=1 Tax=Paracoccus suum TaxID=2259340 RepID=A0A344PJ63_9RHOB|nr:hypothetical protein [Paracoccus suum]AXC49418.1 hypothetical protein DRW48_06685 [Paracoccus suum]
MRQLAVPAAIAAALSFGVLLPALAANTGVVAPFLGGGVPACEAGAPCAAKDGNVATAPAGVIVGNTYPDAHIITEPGRYGLTDAPAGEAYAVIGKTLARVDKSSFKVLSILRPIEGLRD